MNTSFIMTSQRSSARISSIAELFPDPHIIPKNIKSNLVGGPLLRLLARLRVEKEQPQGDDFMRSELHANMMLILNLH
jgi:hypothetical protein